MTDVEAYVIEPERKSRHYKWWFVGVGALITLLGIACLVWPEPALMAVAVIVGLCFLASGITSIGAFFDLGGFGPLSGWSLAMGVIDVLLGVTFLVEPMAGGVAVAWLAGVAVMVAGIMDSVACWRMRETMGGVWSALGIAGGVLSALFGILMMAMPALFIIFLGCMAIMRGVMVIVAAFRVSSFVRDLKSELGA